MSALFANTPLLVVMLAQIALTSSNSVFHRKDMQIVNDLQSTFPNTTNVLFLVDSVESFFAPAAATDVVEVALKLFSLRRTFHLLALNNFANRTESERNSDMIGKLKQPLTSKKVNSQGRHQPISFATRSQETKGLTKSSVLRMRGSLARLCPGDYKTKFNVKDPGDETSYSEPKPVPTPMNLKLSATTSIVFLLRNLSAINLVESFAINSPPLIKIIFLYDECMDNGELAATKRMADFARNMWLKFRLLFRFFASHCSQNFANNNNFDSKEKGLENTSISPVGCALRAQINNWVIVQNTSLIQSLYAYNPFLTTTSNVQNRSSRQHHEGHYGELKKINLTTNHSIMENETGRRVIFNANGHPFRVVAFTTPNTIQKADFSFLSRHLEPELLENPFSHLEAFVGVEVLILRELAFRMNFTPKLVPVSDRMAFGWKNNNGTFLGALGDLVYQRADISMNGFFIKDYETKDLIFTTSIQDDKICVAVKTPALIPHSLLLFKVFSPPVWLLVIMTFVIASVLYSFVLFTVDESNQEKRIWSSSPTTSQERGPYKQIPFKSANEIYNRISTIVSQCFRIIAVLLNASLSHSFNTSSYERFFVVLCLLLGLNLTGSFQGSLVDVYTTGRHYPSIGTLQQLDETGMLIILEHAGLQADVFGTDPPGSILGNLRRKIRVTGVLDDILLQQIGTGRKFSALVRLGDFDRIKFKIPYGADGKTLIHVIPDCPRTYTIAFLVHKSSELYSTMNYYLSLIAASGLLEKWTRDSVYMFRLHGNLKNRESLTDSKIILTISHLQLAFFALTVGLVTSVILFVIEIYLERRRVKLKANTVKMVKF